MHVLVIEDDAELRGIIAMLLKQAGYDVTEAESGEAGLAAWRAYPPRLVLIDIGLPGINGWDLCQHIRAESSIPIVIVSIADRVLDQNLAEQFGVADYIAKPFSARDLVLRVRRVLEPC